MARREDRGIYWIKVILTISICFSYLFQFIDASSTRPLPLKQISYISNVKIEKFNVKRNLKTQPEEEQSQQISHSDNFRLSFEAFDNTFHLHLSPTENLVPPEGATIRYTSLDTQTGQYVISNSETVYPDEIRAYRGVVVHEDHTARRIAEDRIGFRRDLDSDLFSNSNVESGVMGIASLILHGDGATDGIEMFEGTFDWLGNQHTIQLPSNYQNSKSDHDPTLNKRALRDSTLIVHRNSDRLTWEEAHSLGIRTDEKSDQLGCQADSYDFNAQHALRLPSTNNAISPLSFFDSSHEPKLGRKRMFPDLFGGSMMMTERSLLPTPSTFSYDHPLIKRQGDVLGGNGNSSYINSIGSTSGCPNANRVVYMGVATDCTYTAKFANSSAARIQVLNNMNTVSNIYRNTFKVSLGVVELDIRESNNCPTAGQGDARWNQACSDSYTLDQRLSDFSDWRGNQPANGTGLWHLLTTCLSGSEAGVAWLGTLCETRAQGSSGSVVSGTGVTVSTENEAQTMAHEIGHNFGAVHDCVDGCSLSRNSARQNGGAVCCPQSSSSCNSNAAYIMSPVAARSTSSFSPCSIGNICSMLGQGLDTSCVVDPTVNGRETLSIQQCGNGILEPGEECDAGPQGSSCCTTQCRLTSGSQCDPEGTACCTDQCQFANSTTVCRTAIDDRCDTAETCTGMSAECPTDLRKEDGSSCGSGLQCASGHCTSRDLQCQQQSATTDFTFTQACSVSADNSCSVSCVDPSNANACAILQQNFIDGTECGYGGHCAGGRCQSGSWQNTFESWYRNNLRISIPVTIVVGVLVLAILFGIVRCLCFGGRRNSKPNPRPMRQSAYNQPPPPQHPYRTGGAYHQQANVPPSSQPFRQSGGWMDQYDVNGPVGPEISGRR